MNFYEPVVEKATRLFDSNKKDFWRFVEEHGPCLDNGLLFVLLSSLLEIDEPKDFGQLFKLALFTNITALLKTSRRR